MEPFWANLTYALRALRKSPVVTVIALASLALGIGANTAIFTLVNALLLRELPVREPERLVEISVTRPDSKVPFSYPMFRELERGQKVFSDLMGWSTATFNVEVDQTISQSRVVAVTGNYYSGLGVTASLGRLLELEDVNPHNGTTSQVAVIGYQFWQNRFASRPDVVGKQIRIEGQPFTIIGVTRKWFTGMTPGEPPDITIPITEFPAVQGRTFSLDSRSTLWIFVTGRLKNGIDISQARPQLLSFWPGVLEATASTDTPGPRRQRFLSMGLELTPAGNGIAKDLRAQFTRPIYIVWGVVALILLVACVNLASLMLARAATRAGEMSVRVALGASRWALARQVLTETLVLSISGAIAGFVFSYWGSQLLVTLMTEGYSTPIALDLRPDVRVLLLTASMALVTGLLMGLVPAWRSARRDPSSILHQAGRGLAFGVSNLGKGLIVTQIALSLTLLLGGGLLVRSFLKLRSIDPGFAKESLLEISLSPKPGGYQAAGMMSYRKQLITGLSHLPEVRSASFSSDVFPGVLTYRDAVSSVSANRETGNKIMGAPLSVWPGFFNTLGIRIARGREFLDSDDEKHPRVTVISASLARRLFPDIDAVGQHIRFGVMPEFQDLEIVGVANDARLFDLRDPSVPVIYYPTLQHDDWLLWGTVFVRTNQAPDVAARTIGNEIESFGREYPLSTKTATQAVNQALIEERVIAMLSGCFAALALLLASIGLYGLISNGVTRRTREIGVRVALGAQHANILWIVMKETAVLTLLGIAVGVPFGFGCSRFIDSLLFGVSSTDPYTVGMICLLLLTVAAVAGYLPARRASRIDPIIALRAE